jgi:hypothetical protein
LLDNQSVVLKSAAPTFRNVITDEEGYVLASSFEHNSKVVRNLEGYNFATIKDNIDVANGAQTKFYIDGRYMVGKKLHTGQYVITYEATSDKI